MPLSSNHSQGSKGWGSSLNGRQSNCWSKRQNWARVSLLRIFKNKPTGEGNGTPHQYSCLESPMDRGAWWAAVHGVAKNRTPLSDSTFTFHSHALEKEMATHSSVPAWRTPGTGEPGGLPSMGSHRVGHAFSDSAAAAVELELKRQKRHESEWRGQDAARTGLSYERQQRTGGQRHGWHQDRGKHCPEEPAQLMRGKQSKTGPQETGTDIHFYSALHFASGNLYEALFVPNTPITLCLGTASDSHIPNELVFFLRWTLPPLTNSWGYSTSNKDPRELTSKYNFNMKTETIKNFTREIVTSKKQSMGNFYYSKWIKYCKGFSFDQSLRKVIGFKSNKL